MKDLILDAVSKSYDSSEVLKDVYLTVRKGDFIAVVGPSGSGKTTLLGIMGGLDKPSSGRVLYDRKDLAAFDDERLARYRNRAVGFVHQTFNLVPFLTATENVMVPLIIAGGRTSEALTRSAELLAAVGLKEKAELVPRRLAGGLASYLLILTTIGAVLGLAVDFLLALTEYEVLAFGYYQPKSLSTIAYTSALIIGPALILDVGIVLILQRRLGQLDMMSFLRSEV